MGKRKPKLVRHELPGSVFLFFTEEVAITIAPSPLVHLFL